MARHRLHVVQSVDTTSSLAPSSSRCEPTNAFARSHRPRGRFTADRIAAHASASLPLITTADPRQW
ncbi:hypothetical protein SLI_7295 [Streptomyces lividans 1326]|uniref:Uncharacterized protein n=1 Tax=Streptomyces lividans 1326 TaxID=1200984 RepID=A0A7U9HF49_STRLI|nr:hypothetical protein SLI_7295 [Streptomyces lividans 1326]